MNSRVAALSWTWAGTEPGNVRKKKACMLPRSSPVPMKDRHARARTLSFNVASQQERGRRKPWGAKPLISTGSTADDSILVVSLNTIW